MTTRRNFLKCSALLGAAAYFPVQYSLAQDTPTPPAGGRDPLFAVQTGIEATFPSRRVITIPDVAGYKVLKGDFHIHTLFSDGHVMPDARVQEALRNGFDCISITDHIEYRPFLGGQLIKLAEHNDDHNIAFNLAKPTADRNHLILIRGTEITKSMMPPGHFNALFVKDVNPIAAAVDDWKKMLAVAVEQGGFIMWNHPGWVAPTSGGIAKGVPMSFSDEHEDARKKGLLHGIEVFNDKELYPIVSDWCNERDLSVLASSDIHDSELQRYGIQNLRRPITLILAKERTEESIKEAFFAHRTIGWVADKIFGRPEWVEKLFTACVDVRITNSSGANKTVQIKNKGDIPMHIQSDGGEEHILKPQGEIVVGYVDGKKCRVNNWFVGTDTPLEIDLGT